MLYDYSCSACKHEWEESQLSDNRDRPCKARCPSCNEKDAVSRGIGQVTLSYMGNQCVQSRATPQFKERLKAIKAGTGKFNTIETA